jgi:hypothetical protein
VSLHVIILLPTVWAIGLSQQMDQLQGLTSVAPYARPEIRQKRAALTHDQER